MKMENLFVSVGYNNSAKNRPWKTKCHNCRQIRAPFTRLYRLIPSQPDAEL